MTLYRNILSQAWKITWKNKYLWFFGLFAALLSSGGELEILSSGFGDDPLQGSFSWFQSFRNTGVFSWQAIKNIPDLARTDSLSLLIILFIAAVILLLAVFLIWLSTSAQIALVNNTAKHLKDEKSSIKEGIEAGLRKFWPVLGLNAVLKLVISIVLFVFSLPVLYVASKAGLVLSNLFYILMFVAFIVVVLGLTFIVKYAIGYSVLKGEKLCNASKAGWQLFLDNWLVSMEMALILFGIGFVVTFLALITTSALFIPTVFVALILARLSTYMFLIFVFLAFLFFLFFVMFIGATLTTFQSVAWTSLYIELVNKGAQSKLVRVVNNLLDGK